MKKVFLFLLMFSFQTDLLSQDLKGIWISKYRMDVRNNEGNEKKSEFEEHNNPVYEAADTSYFPAYSLLHFYDEGKVSLEGIGSEKVLCEYEIVRDTILLDLDTVQLKFVEKDNDLVFLNLDPGYQSTYFFFERMAPLPDLSNEPIKLNFEAGQYWKSKADSSSINFGLELIFQDSGKVVIDQRYSSGYAYTARGVYQLLNAGNNLFMYLRNEEAMEERMFRVYSKEDQALNVQNFEDRFDSIPVRYNFQLEKQSLPKKRVLKRDKKNVVGTWILDQKMIQRDSIFGLFRNVNNYFLELVFLKEGSYTLKYGGKIKGSGQYVEKEIEGHWKLGVTGRYINLKEVGKYWFNIPLIGLTKDHMTTGLSLQELGSDFSSVIDLYGFKKQIKKN